MILFALFTLGYFIGVFTALLVFPPKGKRINKVNYLDRLNREAGVIAVKSSAILNNS